MSKMRGKFNVLKDGQYVEILVEQAEKDANGNVINDTYASIDDLLDGKIVVLKADKLNAPRKITLSGDIDGSVSFDGSGDITIETADTLRKTSGLYHNSIYRGKDLTSYFAIGEMSQAIANGTFKDIYIGDYIIKPITVDGTTYNVKWVVADFDYYYGVGDTECTAHHILMIPDVTVQLNVSMNDTNDTTGAYLGSNMWTVNMPLYKTGIINAFGDAHVLKHRELLTKTMSPTAASAAGAGWTGSCTDWAWTDTWVNIPNEPMVYGGRVFSSSGYDVGCANKQLALFRHERFSKNKYSDGARKWFWLRAVASGSWFCLASSHGYADYVGASYRDSGGGIRPYFLLR